MPNGEEPEEEPEEGAPEEEKAPPDLAGFGRRAYDIGKRFGRKPGGGLGKGAAGAAGKGAGKAATGAAGKAAAAGAGKAAGTAAGAAAGTAVAPGVGTVIGALVSALASKLIEKFGPKVIKWAFYILLVIFLLSVGAAIAFWGILGGGEYFGSRMHWESQAATQNKVLALAGNEAALRQAIVEDSKGLIEALEKLKPDAAGDASIIALIEQTIDSLEKLAQIADTAAKTKEIDKIVANIKTIAEKLGWPTETTNERGFVLLPKEGVGFRVQKPDQHPEHYWGKPELVYFIKKSARMWHDSHPDITILVNDMSLSGGGPMSPHVSHQNGIDVDISTADKNGCDVAAETTSKCYDKNLAKELASLFKRNGAKQVGFADRTISPPVEYWADHTNHMHARIASGTTVVTILLPSQRARAETQDKESAAKDEPAELQTIDESSLETPLSKLFKTSKTLDIFKSIDPQHRKIIASEKDVEAIREGRIDEGLLKTLIYLVTPKDQGGVGFERLKLKRLVKNYSTERRALSKETEYKDESETNISAHFKGQAMDISEIDKIRFKKVTKKKVVGVTVSKKSEELPPVPIQVAWQSEKGKGEGLPGFYGQTANQLFGNLSLGAIKEVLGDEIEYNLQQLMGENFPEWAKWLGVIVLFEDFDLPIEGFEEEEDFQGMIKKMGRATIAEALGIDISAVKGDSREELILNIGKSYLEEKLEIEQGSLTGETLDEIFKNTGRRKLEKELGLKKGSLDGDLKAKLGKIREKWKNYKTNQAKDESLDMPAGSAERIEAGNENGLALVGAGVLAYALAIENKGDLFNKIRNGESITFDLKISEAGLRVDVEPDVLKKIVSSNKDKRKEALKSLGEKTIDALAFHPDLSLGLTQKDWEKVKKGQMKISDLAVTVGARKYENEFELPVNALYYTVKSGKPGDFLSNIGRAAYEEEGQNPKKYTDDQKKAKGKEVLKQVVAKELNGSFGLSGTYEITDQDIIDLFNGKWETFTQKIGGKQIDYGMKFPENGTLDIIKGKKSTEQVFKESGAIRLGYFLGLSQPVSIEGNVKQNYGQALIEETLGLQKGTFSGTISEVKAKNADRFDVVFKKPEEADALLGISAGSTKELLDGKISVSDYNNRVASKALAGVAFAKLIDYFGLTQGYGPSEEEVKKTVSTLQNWGSASPVDKAAALSTLERISGHSFDAAFGFEAGTIESIVSNPSGAPDILLTQGMKKLNRVFGFEQDVFVLHYKEGKGLDFEIDKKALKDWGVPKIREMTGIEDEEDAKSFLNGNIKDGFIYWGLASLSKEANQYLPFDAQISYSQAKSAYFGDPELENAKVNEALAQLPPGASPEQKEAAAQHARTEVRGELRKEFQYKVYDGFLRKADPNIPVGFTKAMFEGTPEQKTAMMEAYAINLITGGKVPVTPEQMKAVNDYLKNKTPENYEKLRQSGVFDVLDDFLAQQNILGVPVLQGTSEALFNAVRTGNYTQLTNLYKDWLTNQVFSFADSAFGFPAGTSYQIYEAYTTYKRAYEAYEAAKIAGDVAKIAEASKALDAAKADATALAVHLVAGKAFAQVDEMLGLAPGTTEDMAMFLIYGDNANPIALAYLALALYKNFFTTTVEVWGEKPVCEKEDVKKKLITGLFGKFKSEGDWEKLTGDPEKDFQFYQRHARCQVKRMLGALLDMPEKTGDPNLRATQILTLRQEDAEFYRDKNNTLYGKTQFQRGLRGLMYGELFWQWIHIGY